MIDAQRSAFVTGGVSMVAASRGPGNVPTIARAAGCRVTLDGRRITLLFAASQAAALLESVRATGALSVVFSQPSTHRTIQLKGADAAVAPARPDDRLLAESYAHAFVAELRPLGYAEQLIRALIWGDPEELVAVSFSPSSAFDQTPGPRAGAPISG